MEKYIKEVEGGERLARILDLYKEGKLELADAVDIIKHDEQFVVYREASVLKTDYSSFKWYTHPYSSSGTNTTTVIPTSSVTTTELDYLSGITTYTNE